MATAREVQRQQRALEKAKVEKYLQSRLSETEQKNKELAKKEKELSDILTNSLKKDYSFSLNSIASVKQLQEKVPPLTLTMAESEPDEEPFYSEIVPPGFLGTLLPWVKNKYQQELQTAADHYQASIDAHNLRETQRLADLKKWQNNTNEKLSNERQRISILRINYEKGDPNAVIDFITLMLNQNEFTPNIQRIFKLAFAQESKELVIEQELPAISIIQTISEYRYVKAKDIIESKEKRASEIKALYSDLLSSICLRTFHEIFQIDDMSQVQIATFNGYVKTIDLATGNDIQPYLISARTTREQFQNINLARIDKKVCLRNLGAHVSQQPGEMLPVKPIINFNMVDKRFVEQSDILNEIDTRQNLMELNPFEFENLVSNLFSKMGLETKQTRSSKDGGVDAIAYDQRPILGGKVVIQAKRYKDTVGVAAVRDLYGTMMNEGANKGILVTTSGYGPDAYEFSKDKPIELIDGGGLIYLLKQVGIEAKIININA